MMQHLSYQHVSLPVTVKIAKPQVTAYSETGGFYFLPHYHFRIRILEFLRFKLIKGSFVLKITDLFL